MEYSDKKTDRRVIKTKKAIRHAFLALVAEKEVTNITIKDIADAADINRKTFYNYYRGVYQIVDEIEDEIVSAFTNALNEIDIAQGLRTPNILFSRLTSSISQNLEFYSSIFKGDISQNSLSSKIVTAIKQRARDAVILQLAADFEVVDFVIEYCVSGLVTVFQKWIASDRKISIEEMSDRLSVITLRGVSGVLEEVLGQ